MYDTLRKVIAGSTLFAAALAASACGRPESDPPSGGETPPAVSVGRENVALVSRQELRIGPMLSGELKPAREATVRAEVGGSVLSVTVDRGQSVAAGALLVRIEALALQDGLLSAQSAVRSADQAQAVAEREAERVASLVAGGALADRDLELARAAVTSAVAQAADARARLAAARKQLDAATVEAPLSGVVSDRMVNEGDVVSPGSALITVIDPSSMRLEASVPSEALSSLRVGAPVEFQVRGYPDQVFSGRIERISPAADPATRQVPIFVAIPNAGGKLLAGLFAEGRVASESRSALVVPEAAVNATGQASWVMRIRDGKAERIDVQVGATDDRDGRVEIRSGLAEGDSVLVGAAQAVTPGTLVRVADKPRAAAVR